MRGRLGRKQQAMLRLIAERGYWHRYCGWNIDDDFLDQQRCEALHKRGFLTREYPQDIHGHPPLYRRKKTNRETPHES